MHVRMVYTNLPKRERTAILPWLLLNIYSIQLIEWKYFLYWNQYSLYISAFICWLKILNAHGEIAVRFYYRNVHTWVVVWKFGFSFSIKWTKLLLHFYAIALRANEHWNWMWSFRIKGNRIKENTNSGPNEYSPDRDRERKKNKLNRIFIYV